MTSKLRTQIQHFLRYSWPVLIMFAILWFPFDWLSEVWPAFGGFFHIVFRTTHDHFVGHTTLFLITGLLVMAYIPLLRYKPHWYLAGLALAAMTQEAIQAIFAGHLPTFTDANAFRGDALGGISALIIWQIALLLRQKRHNRLISTH